MAGISEPNEEVSLVVLLERKGGFEVVFSGAEVLYTKKLGSNVIPLILMLSFLNSKDYQV